MFNKTAKENYQCISIYINKQYWLFKNKKAKLNQNSIIYTSCIKAIKKKFDKLNLTS